ncbi:MAG: DUF5680 domain-containing protein [Candidatus Pacebacteria bacterium]|nr:DUF5680 domain-containing protein [Candidatus Paceibacterota bacterium]
MIAKNKEKLLRFLLQARTKTYAGSKGKVKPVLAGSKQLEYGEGEWLYRDVYYNGPGIFMGLEAVYFNSKAVWSMSYFGDYQGMTESEVDKILRGALLANWETARIWKSVEWEKDGYKYTCAPDFNGSIEKMAGLEKILKKEKQIYYFFYAGGVL